MMDLARLRSVSSPRHAGTVKVERLEAEGKTRGFHIQYADGRQEAVVRPTTIRTRMSVSRQEVDDGSR